MCILHLLFIKLINVVSICNKTRTVQNALTRLTNITTRHVSIYKNVNYYIKKKRPVKYKNLFNIYSYLYNLVQK